MKVLVLLVAIRASVTFQVKSMRSEVTRDGISVEGVPIPGSSTGLQSLEDLVLKSFENLRQVMLSGSSSNEIPILDPLSIPFSIPLTFPNPICGIGSWQLVLSQLTFRGLSTFRVRSLNVSIGSMSFDNYIANMSATCAYALNYYLTPFSPPLPVCSGTAYGSIVGGDFSGSGQIFPNPSNWFDLATITMTFSIQELDIRIYPNLPYVDPTIQQQIENTVYDAIQQLKPNISSLTQMTYTKTVSLNLGGLPTVH